MKKILCVLLSVLTLISFAWAFGCNDTDQDAPPVSSIAGYWINVEKGDTELPTLSPVLYGGYYNFDIPATLSLQANFYKLRFWGTGSKGQYSVYKKPNLKYDNQSVSIESNPNDPYTLKLKGLKECQDLLIEWCNDDGSKVLSYIRVSFEDVPVTYLQANVYNQTETENVSKLTGKDVIYTSSTLQNALPSLSMQANYYLVEIGLIDFHQKHLLEYDSVTAEYDQQVLQFFAHPYLEKGYYCVVANVPCENQPINLTYTLNGKTFETTLYVKFA